MQEINRRPPESMTMDDRLDEVAVLLARGIARLWADSVAKSANVAVQSQFGLGYSGDQRVHTGPHNTVTESQ
jgi:hypothetical protein